MKHPKGFLLATILLVMLLVPTGSFAQEHCGATYTVQPGDSMAKIAKRCGTSLDFLLLVNPQLENPRLIYPGQEINIPESEDIISKSNQNHLAVTTHPVVGTDERWIDIDISEQTLRAFEGDELVRTFRVSTGTWRHPTVIGQFNIWIKFRHDDMRGPGYFFEDVPYTMYFHESYGIHGTYWHNKFGTPMSHGCVNLKIKDAAWLFEFASVGTLVYVHE